jgi:hypothetical protein
MPRLVSTSGRPSSLPTPLPADLPVSVVYSEAGSTAPLLLFCLLQRGAAFHRRSVQGQQGETAGRERQTTRGKVVIIDTGGQTLRMFAEVIRPHTPRERSASGLDQNFGFIQQPMEGRSGFSKRIHVWRAKANFWGTNTMRTLQDSKDPRSSYRQTTAPRCDTNMTTTSKEDTSAAIALLRETSYFAHAPEALLQELAGP